MSLNRKALGLGPLKFPKDSHDQLKSRISFQAIQIDPPTMTPTFTDTVTSTQIKEPEGTPSDGIFKTVKNVVTGSAVETLSTATATKIIPLQGDKVELYLPIAFTVSDNFQYEQSNLGMAGGAVTNALQQGGDLPGSLWGGIKAGASGILDFMKIFAGTEAATRLAAIKAMEYGPASIRDAVSVAGRITVNPNLRTRFSGTNIREFNFQFKLIAKSQKESVEIKNIVKFFRFHSYPDGVPPGNDFSIALNYPNLFKIRLQSGSRGAFKNIGTPIKYSYLRSITAIYNPTSPVLHADGAPTEVDLNLSFMEYKPLRRRDILLEDKDAAFDLENGNFGANPPMPETDKWGNAKEGPF